MRFINSIVIVFLFFFAAEAVDLNISPRRQQTVVWCWVAVGEMVFEHFEIPNVNPMDFQCGIVGLLAIGSWRNDCAFSCSNCTVPAGSGATITSMIENYPQRVAAYTGEEVPRLRAKYTSSALSSSALIAELDNDRPVIAGISPTAQPPAWGSQHVALIVGYKDEEGELLILINDPYPFNNIENPYYHAGGLTDRPGAYWISYQAFRNSLNWRESITVRQFGSFRATPTGNYCCFSSAYRAGSCPLNLSNALPLGSSCSCIYPTGYLYGRVCDR